MLIRYCWYTISNMYLWDTYEHKYLWINIYTTYLNIHAVLLTLLDYRSSMKFMLIFSLTLSLSLYQTLSLGTLVCNLPPSFCCCYYRLFCVPLWWSCGDEDRHDEHLLSVGTATCWLFVVIVSSIFLFTQFCRLFFLCARDARHTIFLL